MKIVKGIYLGDVEILEGRLNVWMNPETKKIFALANMEIDATKNYANDPYDENYWIVFENTFSGLPK